MPWITSFQTRVRILAIWMFSGAQNLAISSLLKLAARGDEEIGEWREVIVFFFKSEANVRAYFGIFCRPRPPLFASPLDPVLREEKYRVTCNPMPKEGESAASCTGLRYHRMPDLICKWHLAVELVCHHMNVISGQMVFITYPRAILFDPCLRDSFLLYPLGPFIRRRWCRRPKLAEPVTA